MMYTALIKTTMQCRAMFRGVFLFGVLLQVKAQTFSLRNCNKTGVFNIVQHQQTSLSCIGLTNLHNIYWSITNPPNSGEQRIGECEECKPRCPHCSVFVKAYNLSRPVANKSVLQLPDRWDISDGSAVKCSSFNNKSQTICQVSVIADKRTDDGMRAAEIAGGAVGLTSLIVIVLIVAAVIKRKRTPEKTQGDGHHDTSGRGFGNRSTTSGRDGGHVNEGAVDIMNDTFLSLEEIRALMLLHNLGPPISVQHLDLPNPQPRSKTTAPTTTNTHTRHKARKHLDIPNPQPPLKTTAPTSTNTHTRHKARKHLDIPNPQPPSTNTAPTSTNTHARHKARKHPPATTSKGVPRANPAKEEGKPASSERVDDSDDYPYAKVQKKVKKNTHQPDIRRQRREGRDKTTANSTECEYANQNRQTHQDHRISPVYKNIGEVCSYNRQKQGQPKGAQAPKKSDAVELSELNTTGRTKNQANPTPNRIMDKHAWRAAETVTKAADIDDDYHTLHFSRSTEPRRDSTYNHLTGF